MPQYALIGGHPPNGCPLSSKGAREAAKQAYSSIEKAWKAKHVNLVLNLHLDPSHKVFMLFDAPSAETLRDCLVECGFLAFLDLDFHLVTPIPDLLKAAANFPVRYP